MNNILCLQLVNGMELMGKLDKENENSISLKDVAQIATIPNQAGQMSVGLFPWLPYAEKSEFQIQNHNIVVKFIPGLDMVNNYNKFFGSGIQIASASALR
jgi:hypothetical protein